MKTKIFKKTRSKNIFSLSLVIILLLLIMCSRITVLADNGAIGFDNIFYGANDVLNSLNLSDLQGLIDNLQSNSFFDGSVLDVITNILNGEFNTNYSSIIQLLFNIIFINVKKIIPIICTIIAIGILTNTLVSFKKDGSKSTEDIIYFVCLSLLSLIILIVFKELLSITYNTLHNLLKQMEIVFPILITLLSTVGSISTISILNPTIVILTSITSLIFNKLLYPIFFLIFILTILNSLTNTVKLDKFLGFFTSFFKWSIGTVITLFTGLLGIQGVSAGKFDSVSIKTTKFAIKSYIPIIGSFISDGMDFIVLGSVLVKNSIGLIGVFIIFITIISPVINILIFKLGLQLSSAILELGGGNKMSNFVLDCSKILIYPIVLILGVSFMYLITLCLIMSTANIF